ncbi:MAG: hypothetical protein WDO73_22725 [Ignavibacteriota bacterium]
MKPPKQAKFHDAIRCTLECMTKDQVVTPEEAAAYASRSDEDLALLLIARALAVMIDLQEKVVAAADMLREADKTLELILQAQEAETLEKAA